MLTGPIVSSIFFVTEFFSIDDIDIFMFAKEKEERRGIVCLIMELFFRAVEKPFSLWPRVHRLIPAIPKQALCEKPLTRKQRYIYTETFFVRNQQPRATFWKKMSVVCSWCSSFCMKCVSGYMHMLTIFASHSYYEQTLFFCFSS